MVNLTIISKDTENPEYQFSGRTVPGDKFCGWIGDPAPPLETLPGYGRWLLHAPCDPLQENLTRVILVDSRKFPLHQVSPSLPKSSPTPVISPHTLPQYLPKHTQLIPPVPIPIQPQSSSKIYSIPPSQVERCICPRILPVS